MNKFWILIITLITTVQCGFCATEAAIPELSQSLKTPTGEPGIMSIVFALVFVICLIYVTGIIYQKLNIVGAQKVQEQYKKFDLGNVIVLSTTQLGQGKNLHVIEINDERLLIGATPNSINLIKKLGKKKEEEKAVKAPEVQSEEEKIEEEKAEIYKKYL